MILRRRRQMVEPWLQIPDTAQDSQGHKLFADSNTTECIHARINGHTHTHAQGPNKLSTRTEGTIVRRMLRDMQARRGSDLTRHVMVHRTFPIVCRLMPRQIVCLLCSLPAAYGPQLRTPQPAAANPLTYQGNRLQRHLLLERLLDLAVPGLSQGCSPR